MTPHDPLDHSAVWYQVIAAADYLNATSRPGHTVWHATADAARAWAAALVSVDGEAADGWTVADNETGWFDPDPLRTALDRLLSSTAPGGPTGEPPLHDLLTAALDEWLRRIAKEVNDGHPFANLLPAKAD